MAEIEAAEKDKMREKCMKIINHGINCFIDRQLIYNFPEEIFADHGVMAIGAYLNLILLISGAWMVACVVPKQLPGGGLCGPRGDGHRCVCGLV